LACAALAASAWVCALPARAAESETATPTPPASEELPRPEHEIISASGGGMLASTWRGDLAAYAPFWLGYRYKQIVSLDALTRLGYATVDQRVLTYISLGGTIWGHLGKVQPYLRLALVHQHEESRAAIDADPHGALFGVGNGIRHRGGYAASAGFLVPFQRVRRLGEWYVGLDAWTTYFPDNRGPAIYAGGSGWLGFAFRL
jgi:hypothetical protein